MFKRTQKCHSQTQKETFEKGIKILKMEQSFK